MKSLRILFLVVLAAALPVLSRAADPDLVLYLDFDEIVGDSIPDKSGKGHDGKIQGDVTLDTGKRGKGGRLASTAFLDLDGANWTGSDIPTEGISLLAWIHPDAIATDQAIFNARASDNTFVVHPEVRAEGKFRWLVRTDGAATLFDIRAGVPAAHTWTHFAGVYDRAEGMGRLFINGEEVASAPADRTVAKDWGLGARVGYNIDNARPFVGVLDDLSIWKRGLTAAEVRDVMDNGINLVTAVSAGGKLAARWSAIKRAD